MGNISVLVKQRIQTNILLGVVFAVVAALLLSTHTFAAPAPATNTANTLKISPVRSDIEAAPGTVKTVATTITNLTKGSITVTPIENDFVAGDERGTPALILDPDKFAPTHSLKRFMKPLPNITIEAGKSRTINVTINVPTNAQAGGYFGAIRFAPSTPDGGGQVNLSGSVATLILLKVPGDIIEKVALTDYKIQQAGQSGTFFNSSNDLQVTARFQNTGNAQTAPFGKVSVTQGDKVVYATDFNNTDPRDMILPDSARRWDIPLKNIGSFGNYKVSATFTYGDKNQTIEVTQSFWVVPVFIIVATAVGVLLVVLLIVGIWLFLRSYRRRVLRGSNSGRRR